MEGVEDLHMQNKQRKKSRWIRLNPVVLATVVAVILVVGLYSYFTRELFLQQTEKAVEQNVEKVENSINAFMYYARQNMHVASVLVGNSIRDSVYSVDSVRKMFPKDAALSSWYFIPNDPMVRIERNLPFKKNSVDYLRRGMLGESGFWVDPSEDSLGVLLHFYETIYKGDSIAGVLIASYTESDDFKKHLNYSISGEALVTVLCDNYLTILSTNMEGPQYGIPFEKKMLDFIPEEVYGVFKKRALLGKSSTFRFSSPFGTSVAGIVHVKSTGWYVVQIVPYHILNDFRDKILLNALTVILLVFLLFGLYIFVEVRARRRQYNEAAVHHRNLIDALTDSYKSVVEVNFDTGKVVFLRMNEDVFAMVTHMFEEDILYNNLIPMYVMRFVKEEDRSLWARFMMISSLREEFLQKERFELVYRAEIEGSQHYVQAHFVKPSKDRSEFVIGFRNIDESMKAELEKRKELNEQRKSLMVALEKAEKADKAKSDFLFNMSHDIRTPMNAVLGYSDLSLRALSEVKLDQDEMVRLHRYLDNINMSGRQLLDIINSVLNMSRIESGVVGLDENPVLVASLSGNIIASFEQEAEKRNIFLHVSRNLRVNNVYTDKVKLQQILLNIVSNAIKYTEAYGSVRVSFRDLDHPTPGMCYLEITVDDTGVGISESFLPHIFDAFERERTANTQKVSGSGLGLSIVKKYVDLMNGSIDVQSELGKGTHVVVTLPLKIAPETVQYDPMSKVSEEMKKKRVLLVEDNEMNAEIEKEMLETMGLNVDWAADAETGIQMLQAASPDDYGVVLLDIQLPGMDGFEAVRVIRNMIDFRKSKLPVIAMTAHAFDETRVAALRAGMDDVITKPVDSVRMAETLAKYLS